MKCPKRTERGVFCIRPQTEWRERFDLFCFVFVCDCTSLAIAELSYHLLSNFFLDQKKRTMKLNFILGLLGNSREILSAAVLDSTDAKCINTFIELIFIYNRRLTLFTRNSLAGLNSYIDEFRLPQILLLYL